jgi:hypothetical protein
VLLSRRLGLSAVPTSFLPLFTNLVEIELEVEFSEV